MFPSLLLFSPIWFYWLWDIGCSSNLIDHMLYHISLAKSVFCWTIFHLHFSFESLIGKKAHLQVTSSHIINMKTSNLYAIYQHHIRTLLFLRFKAEQQQQQQNCKCKRERIPFLLSLCCQQKRKSVNAT